MRRFPDPTRGDGCAPAWRQSLSDSSDLLGVEVSVISDLLPTAPSDNSDLLALRVPDSSDLLGVEVSVISDLLPTAPSDNSDLLALRVPDSSDLLGVELSVISDLFAENERPGRAVRRSLMMIHQCIYNLLSL